MRTVKLKCSFRAVVLLACLGLFTPFLGLARQTVDHYEVWLETDLTDQSVHGVAVLTFEREVGQQELVLDCGALIMDGVAGDRVGGYCQENGQLFVGMSDTSVGAGSVTVHYHGQPGRGLQFAANQEQVYSYYFTSAWMPCLDSPSERATLDMHLILADTMTAVASGVLVGTAVLEDGTKQVSFQQRFPTSSYTYGFAVGNFSTYISDHKDIQLTYLGRGYSSEELAVIFRETGDMLDFFEGKSGLPYFQSQYSQILGQGNISQEMSGFTVLRHSYGRGVLGDTTDLNLAAHELAHQWWGNGVTCRDWGHFWLNEGMAVFLSSAYKEHRFGREVYEADIDLYFQAYQGVVQKGQDKALVFADWDAPTVEDRTLVYYKGAYVLHLLREELGEQVFWEGIRQYTRKFWGQSVTTADFRAEMEQVSGRGLEGFFRQWIE